MACTTRLHNAAGAGDVAEVEQLLAEGFAPDSATPDGTTPLHIAAEYGHVAVVEHLLQAASAAALVQDRVQATPLLHAIRRRHVAAARRLLEAAPAAASITRQGYSPLHYLSSRAESPEELGLARLLLAAAPQMATNADRRGAQPIHTAASYGRVGMFRLLLEAAPSAAAGSSGRSLLPDAAGAPESGSAATMVRLLLDRVPEAAAARMEDGYTALHQACRAGNAEAAGLIAQAAPATAQARASSLAKKLPLGLALCRAATALGGAARVRPVEHYFACMRAVMPFTPPVLALPDLARWAKSYTALQPLFADYVSHWPLSLDQWDQVPAPCRGLSRALPAVLARSDAEGALLVARLPEPDRARLRTCALCLHRCQNSLQVQLPPVLVRHILSLSVAQ